MNTQTQAIYVLAAAVIAHPFITKTVNGWGTYRSDVEAAIACKAAKVKGAKVDVNGTYYSSRDCSFMHNHYVLFERENKRYLSHMDFRNSKTKTLHRFYF